MKLCIVWMQSGNAFLKLGNGGKPAMERNFETVMIEQCSPVLAGLKAAGLFRYET